MRTSICADCPATVITEGIHGRLKQRCPECERPYRNLTFKASKERMRRRVGMKLRPQYLQEAKRKPIPYAGYQRRKDHDQDCH